VMSQHSKNFSSSWSGMAAEGGGEGKCVLVTGGAGYIGSHCCVSLLEAGYDVVVVRRAPFPRPPCHASGARVFGSRRPPNRTGTLDDCALRTIICCQHARPGLTPFPPAPPHPPPLPSLPLAGTAQAGGQLLQFDA